MLTYTHQHARTMEEIVASQSSIYLALNVIMLGVVSVMEVYIVQLVKMTEEIVLNVFFPEEGLETYSIAVQDLNNDTFPDIVIGNNGGLNKLMFNNGDGTFRSVILPGRKSKTWSVSIGDVNQDGWTDIAIGNMDEKNVLHFNEGDGIFSINGTKKLPDGEKGPMHTASIVLADTNGDGFPDLVIGNDEPGAGPMDDAEADQLLLNDGHGILKRSISDTCPLLGRVQ